MKSFNYFNVRTFLILLISQIAVFLTITFGLKLNLNLMLFGLAIGFPLGFSIQAAFKRRDRALEYLSLFKGGMLSLYYSFATNDDLKGEQQKEIKNILTATAEQLFFQLENHMIEYAPFQKKANELFIFCDRNQDNISNRSMQRIIRYYRDVALSSAYLIGLVRHRTMAGLRFYAITFIALFPLVQAPLLYYHMEAIIPHWAFYIFVALSSLLLVTLNNFQNAIEYPFDPEGMDNIHIRDFKMNLEGAAVENDIRQTSEIV
jgi:hypothetical protein